MEENMKLFPSTVINFHAIYDYHWMDGIFSLLKRLYKIVPLSELESFYYEGGRLKNAGHITFDDGDISFYNIVYPLLKKHNIPVSIYVSPKAAKERINFWFQEIREYDDHKLMSVINSNIKFSKDTKEAKSIRAILKSLPLNQILAILEQYRCETNTSVKPPMNMTINQLRELDASDLVTIGAHTLNHPILKNESNKECETEIKNSIEGLSEILNKEITCFAYPNGSPGLDFDHREINILKDNNIKTAFSTENKALSKNDNPLSIPRNGISYGSKSFVFIKLLSGKRWVEIKKLLKGKQEDDQRRDVIDLLNL